MMGVKGSYNLLRSSLFKDEVFLDISVWWSSLRYQNHPPSTNVSALHGETLCWQLCPSLGAEPFGQAAQTSSVSVRAGDECGLLRFPTSEPLPFQVHSRGWVKVQGVLMNRQLSLSPALVWCQQVLKFVLRAVYVYWMKSFALYEIEAGNTVSKLLNGVLGQSLLLVEIRPNQKLHQLETELRLSVCFSQLRQR